MKSTSDKFYSSLATGEIKRRTFGLQKRYSYENVVSNPSVKKYLLPFFDKELVNSDVVLDYGCGAGVLMPIISAFSKEVHGFDIAIPFIDLAKKLIKEKNIMNASAYTDTEFNEKFSENCFDVVLINDVLHHMENPQEAIYNAFKLLRPEGKLIVIEPNRFNPAMFISQVIEPNEWKWLKMGYFGYYEEFFGGRGVFKMIKKDWIPLVYGPSSKLVFMIAEICENFPFRLLRWGAPRIFLIFKVNK